METHNVIIDRSTTRDYQRLFSLIVNILRRDYAGAELCRDRFDPRYYNQSVGQAWNDGILCDTLFFRYMQQMLGCIGDRHLFLEMLPDGDYTPSTPGFTARAAEDTLYVESVNEETRLVPGDKITAINGGHIPHHRKVIQKNFLYGDTPEREDWSLLLELADTITVEGKGELERKLYPLTETTIAPTLRIENGVALIRPGTLNGSGNTAALLEKNRKELQSCHRLIWDCRYADGSFEAEISGLLPWLCRKPTRWEDLSGETEIFVNYSQRNCALRIAGLREYPDTEDYIRELRSAAGKGFTTETVPAEVGIIEPATNAESVILTDVHCRFAGEILAQTARAAGARILGRPTAGTLNYCADVAAALDDRFILHWPTAVSSRAFRGEILPCAGLEPDVLIPWTPEECRRDLLAEAAIHL